MSHFPFFGAALAGNGPRWTGRRPRGVPLIIVMSAAEAIRMRPRSAHGVIVSLHDPGTPPVPLSPRWEAVLRLELFDISWDGKSDPTPESLADQAASIVEFVHAHRRAPLIAFHCHAGISRSRTAAAVVCQHYGWPYEWHPLHYALEAAIQAAFAGMEERIRKSQAAGVDAQAARMQEPKVRRATTRGFHAPLDDGVRRPDNRDARSHGPTEVAAPSLQEMFEASLLAFWTLAKGCDLTETEQAGMLAVSEHDVHRWRRETPPVDVNVLDRLQLVLQTYASLSALAPVSEKEKGILFRTQGSAESPDKPALSLLEALSVPSILEMNAHCQRFGSRRHAV